MAGTLIKRVLLQVTADDGDTEAKLEAISLKADELAEKHPELKVRIDTAAASAKVAVLRQELRGLSAQADEEAAKGGLLSRFLGGAEKVSGKGPWWLGPLLGGLPFIASMGGVAAGAGIGLGGAAIAGAGALAAFGAVAKPVLADALTAEQAVSAAQNTYNTAIAAGTSQAVAYKAEQIAIGKAYADMSPQQIALSRQLGDMSAAWQNLKAAQTPVIAGALQPWLQSVTDLTGKLGPVIGAVSPYIADLGTQFDSLISSDAFTQFRDFVAGAGSSVVGAAGHTLIDFVQSLIVLLPQFDPLIAGTAREISKLGPAVLTWASSKKTADDIQKFMDWFSQNGPAAGAMFRNLGGALKALSPGLGPAGTAEISVFSQFFGFIAKLPPGLATPLTEVAAVLLTLNKLGLVNVGVKFLGLGGAAGSAEGAAGEAAAGGAAAGLWSKMLPGVRFAGGVLVATLVVSTVLKNTSSGTGKNWWDNPFGQGTFKDPKTGKTQGTATALTSWITFGHDIEHYWGMTWNNTIGRSEKGWSDLTALFDSERHNTAGIFDGIRHDISHIWDLTWNNTVGRLTRGLDDMDNLLGGWEHNFAHWFDVARHDVAHWTDNVVSFFAGLPRRITSALGSLGSLLYNAGRNVIQGLINGINSMLGAVGSAMSGILGKVRGFLPFSPAREGPLSGAGSPDIAGRKIGMMLAAGMGESSRQVQLAASKMAQAANPAGGVAAHGAAGTAGQPVIQIHFQGGDQAFRTWLKRSIRITGGQVQVIGA